MKTEESQSPPTVYLSRPAVKVLSPVQDARAEAKLCQHGAGRSPAGRAWALIVSKLEEVAALIRYYDVNPGLQEAKPDVAEGDRN